MFRFGQTGFEIVEPVSGGLRQRLGIPFVGQCTDSGFLLLPADRVEQVGRVAQVLVVVADERLAERVDVAAVRELRIDRTLLAMSSVEPVNPDGSEDGSVRDWFSYPCRRPSPVGRIEVLVDRMSWTGTG